MTGDRPLPSHPQPTVTSPFWEATADERLLIQQCGNCEDHVWHPRSICPYCFYEDLHWVEASGEGTCTPVT